MEALASRLFGFSRRDFRLTRHIFSAFDSRRTGAMTIQEEHQRANTDHQTHSLPQIDTTDNRHFHTDEFQQEADDSVFNNVKQEDLNSEDFMMWSTIYTDKKDYAKASDLLNKSITLDSTDENAYFEYGKGLFAAQNYADALPKFSKAIDLGIQNVAAYVYKGITYYYLQDYTNAVTWLDKSIALNSTINSAYLWKANSLFAAGKFPEALAVYQTYLEKVPDDEFAKAQVDKIQKK